MAGCSTLSSWLSIYKSQEESLSLLNSIQMDPRRYLKPSRMLEGLAIIRKRSDFAPVSRKEVEPIEYSRKEVQRAAGNCSFLKSP